MREQIKEVAATVFETEVTNETSQTNCEAWDSLHHLNFIVELEIEFDVNFEPEEIAEMKSLAKVEEIIKSKLV